MEQNHVSSMVKRMQKRLSHSDDGVAFKESIKEAVTVGVSVYTTSQLGRIQVNTVSNFEKMVKLGLLMRGEPTACESLK